jgi:hypothetical protein
MSHRENAEEISPQIENQMGTDKRKSGSSSVPI